MTMMMVAAAGPAISKLLYHLSSQQRRCEIKPTNGLLSMVLKTMTTSKFPKEP